MLRLLLISLFMALLSACGDANEHFCARYNYLYDQLTSESDLTSFTEMKQSLLEKIANDDSDKAKMMLFVLEDFHIAIKSEGEEAFDTCMRLKRWQSYR